MKNTVKIICVLTAAAFLFSGCGKKDSSEKKKDKAGNKEPNSNISETVTDNNDNPLIPGIKKTDVFSTDPIPGFSHSAAAPTEKSTAINQSGNSEKTEKKKLPAPAKSNSAGLTYIKGVLIANKSYDLPSDYNPGVDSTAQDAFNLMQADAQKEGISLFIQSGFRSYSYQETIYNNYAALDGKAEADRYSARPGHSEHQTGLAFDVNSLSQSFENTAEGKWLAANCHKYGFIIRYPKGKESVTGYMYEPWHIRYLGTDMAADIFRSGLTLEEYLGITSVYSD